jgi:RNase H-fold protein (predicted Holliday junction resolvase)
MSYVLSLDISTHTIGVCLLDLEVSQGLSIPTLSHLSLSTIDDYYDKIDNTQKELLFIADKYDIAQIVIESPIIKTITSAHTTKLLIQFNSAVSLLCYQVFKKKIVYITSGMARSLCGIPLNNKQKHKKQVIEFMTQNDLKQYNFIKTRNGTYKDYVGDEIDAYVLGKAYLIQNNIWI